MTTTTLETLTAELLAADAAWNRAIEAQRSAAAVGRHTTNTEFARLHAEAQTRRGVYNAARDAFEAAGGDLSTLPE